MPTMWLSDMQKIGVICCSAGGLFFTFGIFMFFDRAMLAMGNILFLAGISLLLGAHRTLLFFARRQKWRGTAAFLGGLALILLRYPLIGFLVEGYGVFVLFGEFFTTIAGFAYGIPVVGPMLARGLTVAGQTAAESGGGARNKDMPV